MRKYAYKSEPITEERREPISTFFAAKRQNKKKWRRLPSLSRDIAKQSFQKLQIPFSDSNHNTKMITTKCRNIIQENLKRQISDKMETSKILERILRPIHAESARKFPHTILEPFLKTPETLSYRKDYQERGPQYIVSIGHGLEARAS